MLHIPNPVEKDAPFICSVIFLRRWPQHPSHVRCNTSDNAFHFPWKLPQPISALFSNLWKSSSLHTASAIQNKLQTHWEHWENVATALLSSSYWFAAWCFCVCCARVVCETTDNYFWDEQLGSIADSPKESNDWAEGSAKELEGLEHV